MPFISQRELGLNLRSKSEKDYRAQLRAALLNPGLSAEQRRDIQVRLAQVGQPRMYDASSPPLPGAIELAPAPVVSGKAVLPEAILAPESLQGMSKADLQALARRRGLPSSGTRTDLMERLAKAP